MDSKGLCRIKLCILLTMRPKYHLCCIVTSFDPKAAVGAGGKITRKIPRDWDSEAGFLQDRRMVQIHRMSSRMTVKGIYITLFYGFRVPPGVENAMLDRIHATLDFINRWK
jgi:hypothetical protein